MIDKPVDIGYGLTISPYPPETLTESQTITVSREAFGVAIKDLLTKLPDMLAESSESLPVYARAAMPVVRMLLASEDMQKSLSGEGVVDFVWSALEACQT